MSNDWILYTENEWLPDRQTISEKDQFEKDWKFKFDPILPIVHESQAQVCLCKNMTPPEMQEVALSLETISSRENLSCTQQQQIQQASSWLEYWLSKGFSVIHY